MKSVRPLLFILLALTPHDSFAAGACRELFYNFPTWAQLEARKPRQEVDAVLRSMPGDFHYHVDVLQLLSDAEIRVLATDKDIPEYLTESRREYERERGAAFPYSGAEYTQLGALIYMMRLDFPLRPTGAAFTQKEFEEQARLSGLQMETVPVAYRMDSRTSEQILKAGGFFPGKDKKELTLIEHSMAKTPGGYWVSTTLQEGNTHLLIQPIFENKIITTDNADFPGTLVSRGNPFGDKPSSYQGEWIALKEYYEYRLENISGVQSGKWSLEFEKEFVTNFILKDHIIAYRKVTLRTYVGENKYRPVHVHEFGPWLSFTEGPK